MNKSPDDPGLILASQSPRRRYLLTQAGLEFSVIPSRFEERTVTPSPPESYAKHLAEHKASDVSAQYPDSWVIGVDKYDCVGADHPAVGILARDI